MTERLRPWTLVWIGRVVLLPLALAGCAHDPDRAAPGVESATIRRPLDPRCEAPAVPIPQVQGAGAVSPRRGERLTIQGVVTGDFQGRDALEGFFLQALEGDGDPATSDAIFVHAEPEVAAGDVVRVEGEVKEFFERTELDDVGELIVCASGARLAPAPLALPLAEDQNLEPFESMLVTVPGTLTLTDLFTLDRFGQLHLAAGGRLISRTNGTAPTDALPAERRVLILDDGSNAERPDPIPYLRDGRPPRLGDVARDLTGVLTFGHGRWMLQPTVPPRFEDANPRSEAPPRLPGELRVVAMNVLNYFITLGERGAATAAELERQERKIVAALVALESDVLGLIEIENHPAALDRLLDALNRATGETRYAAVSDPAGGVGGDEIRVALVYRRDRVRPVGPARAAAGGAFGERLPLAQTFEVSAGAGTGERFTVVVAHFKSKGGCDRATGPDRDQGDGQGCWNDLRTRQSQSMLVFIDELVQGSGDLDVLLIGDLNAYGAEDPIRTLAAGGLDDQLARHVDDADRYSFVYRGHAGYLDHVLATASLAPRVADAAIWHVNADESPLASYRADNPAPFYRPDPFRSSDHDPVIVALSF